MTWYSLDIETYAQYDGTQASRNHILSNQINKETFRELEKTEFTKGKYYPVLNSQDFIIGKILREDGKSWYFYKPEDMWNHIIMLNDKAKKSNKKNYVYGHHHAYDFLGYAKNQYYNAKLKKLVSNPLLYIYDETTYLLDTMFYYRYGLAKVAKTIGIQDKLEMPLSVWSPDELKTYISMDCHITMKAMTHFKDTLKKLGFTPRKFLTAGQNGMNCFLTYCEREQIKTSFMIKNKIYKSKHEEWIRTAFRGGRVETFNTGTYKSVTGKDIKSSYPKRASTMRFPNLKEEIMINKPLEKNYDVKQILKYIGVIECTVKAPNKIEIPYLPIRYHPTKKARKDKLQIYPRDVYMTSVWTNSQIRRALTLGYELVDVEKIIIYEEQEINPLNKYMTHLYQIRKESDEPTGEVIKLLMNSFLMKFAQQNQEIKLITVPRHESEKYERQGYTFEMEYEEMYVMKKNIGEKYSPPYANPLISLLITADGQDALYDELSKYEHDQVLYCDTDSVYVDGTKTSIDKTNLGKEMGDWEITCENEEGEFLGEKKYRIGNQYKLSGIPEKNIEPEQFKIGGVMQRRKQISEKIAQKLNRPDLIGMFIDETFTLDNTKQQIQRELPTHIIDLD